MVHQSRIGEGTPCPTAVHLDIRRRRCAGALLPGPALGVIVALLLFSSMTSAAPFAAFSSRCMGFILRSPKTVTG